jgi:hypothetical protein
MKKYVERKVKKGGKDHTKWVPKYRYSSGEHGQRS